MAKLCQREWMDIFFNTAFSNHDLHGILNAAPIHVGFGFPNGFSRSVCIGKKQGRMLVRISGMVRTLGGLTIFTQFQSFFSTYFQKC